LAAKAVGGLRSFRLYDMIQDLDVAYGPLKETRTNVTKLDDALHTMLLDRWLEILLGDYPS